ncbi:MAG: sel1 repeat family protein [Piscinibacter sp.]|nr:sel1 repeat family protein [Piscinibacter sp.]
MPTRLIQIDQHAPGTAAFQVSGPAVAPLTRPEELEISIIQPGPVERYLDPRNPDEPWSTSVYRFHPLGPRRQGNALWLEIDYGVTYHLRANQPYKLRLRQAEGVEVEEVFTVPAALRRPAAKPQGWTPPPGPRGPLVAPPPPPPEPLPPPPPPEPEPVVDLAPPVFEAPIVEPVAPPEEPPVVVPPPPAPPAPSSGKKWLIPLVVLLALVGGVAGYFLVPGAPGQAMTMDSCRRLVGSGPEAAAARGEADKLAQKHELLDCQFLLYKYAGEKGDAAAARVLGGFYDPDTWSKDKSPLPGPNPLEAARWHKQAAEAGDAESQFRYGMLLKLGRTDAADGPEQAQVWLRKAAEQGHALAKEELAR